MSLPDKDSHTEEVKHDLGISRQPYQQKTTHFLNRRKLLDQDDSLKRQENYEEPSVSLKDAESVCRFYVRHGHCRYGKACKYSHSVTNAELANGDVKQATQRYSKDVPDRKRKTEVCQFFARFGHCRYGWSCRYIHSKARTPAKASVKGAGNEYSEDQSDIAKSGAKEQAGSASDNSGATAVQHPRDVSKEETLEDLRQREIRQFLKRYPRCKEVRSSDGTQRYNIVFEPTDPDWRFDVRQLNLTIAFPSSYPQEYFTVTVFDDDAILPPLLVRDLNKAISAWLEAKHTVSQETNPKQLVLRPFLRWLDRNLENMFIESLRKVKKIQLAEAAGLQFVPYEELVPKNEPSVDSASPGDGNGDRDVTNSNDNKSFNRQHVSAVPNAPEHSNGACPATGPDDENKASAKSDREFSSALPGTGRHQQNDVKDKELSCCQEGELQKTNVPLSKAPPRNNNQSNSQVIRDGESDCSLRSGQHLVNTTRDDSKHEAAATDGTCHTVITNPKRGTEIKFRKLELGENVGTLECQRMALRVQCVRCRCSAEVTTPSRRRNVITCGRCSKTISVVFRPNLMHAFNSVLGFLDLTDCSVLDLMLPACVLTMVCLQCDKQTQLDGIHYGQQKTTWCQSCNSKITFLMESVKFQHLQSAGIHDTAKAFVIKAQKAVKKVRDPAIQEGKPLPDDGTCKHYKKSFRWLRFPCCGKAYPCDVCHEEQEGDHEMKYATRMICGHCAKEQPFSTDKPCTGCNGFMTKKATAHWEGGKGCRDRIKMSRDDNKKYSGTGKTTSRKAQANAPGKK